MTTPLFPNRSTGSGDPAADINALRDDSVSKRGGATITPASAATKGLVIRGVTTQAANLAEFQNDAGTPVLSIRPDGIANYSSTHVTNTARTGGGGNALPASPTTYLLVYVNNQARYIPLYS